MDLETTSLVAKVSSPSLLKLKLNTSQDYSTTADIAFETNSTFEKENYLPENYIITSPDIKSFADTAEDFSNPNFNKFDNRSEYLTDCPLDQYCRDEEDLIDTALIDKDYHGVLLNNSNIDARRAVKYQNLVCSTFTASSDFTSPESILEANSELVDPQDKADFKALDEYLNITEDIEPHFIVGSFSVEEKSTHTADENQLNSPADMGIENTW